jgi:hypothetical protein
LVRDTAGRSAEALRENFTAYTQPFQSKPQHREAEYVFPCSASRFFAFPHGANPQIKNHGLEPQKSNRKVEDGY